MKKLMISLVIVLAVCVSVAMAADDSINTFLQSLPLPTWMKGIVAMLVGGGIIASAIGAFLAKVIPGFAHALTVVKKLLKIITTIKPILQDAYVVGKYGDTLAEANAIIDEVEEFCNDAKIIKKQDFLERWKIKTVNSAKVIAALKASPVIAAADEALK